MLAQQLNNDFTVHASSELSRHSHGFSNWKHHCSVQKKKKGAHKESSQRFIGTRDLHRNYSVHTETWSQEHYLIWLLASAVFWQWKQYCRRSLSDARADSFQSFNRPGRLMAPGETQSDRRSGVSKQTCIPSTETCLTSAASWHPTNTYLLIPTMKRGTTGRRFVSQSCSLGVPLRGVIMPFFFLELVNH